MSKETVGKNALVYQHLLAGITRFGGTPENICRLAFKCEPELISERVILAPMWDSDIFAPWAESITPQTEGIIRKVDELVLEGKKVTFIRTGPGSPAVAHAVFALSCTPCKNIIFIGTAGGMVENQQVGDILIPEYSVAGDGASRYITKKKVKDNDCFGLKYYPHPEIFERINAAARKVCEEYKIGWHKTRTFSVDNIFAEFAHLEEIINLGCDSIEMETALLFRTAEVCDIKAGAVFFVSDNSIGGKSIYGNDFREEREKRDFIRNEIITRIVIDSLP
ncbi:hypothetical protein LQZ19_01500 [Treponema primitia]|uniref:phosphorylase family protein n=1 Tax=Treponema primitia TaxID=88058 RepID=UPI0039802F10